MTSPQPSDDAARVPDAPALDEDQRTEVETLARALENAAATPLDDAARARLRVEIGRRMTALAPSDEALLIDRSFKRDRLRRLAHRGEQPLRPKTFRQRVRAVIERTPWFAAALLLHLALVMLFFDVWLPVPPQPGDTPAAFLSFADAELAPEAVLRPELIQSEALQENPLRDEDSGDTEREQDEAAALEAPETLPIEEALARLSAALDGARRLTDSAATAAESPLVAEDRAANEAAGASKSESAPAGDLFGARSGPAKTEALNRHGGDSKTEDAVAQGLGWLERHQVRRGPLRGMWRPAAFDQECPPDDRCAGLAPSNIHGMDVGITALAALCFLGAGHTPGSGSHGETLTLALQALIACQRDNDAIDQEGLWKQLLPPQTIIVGLVEEDPIQLYNHAVATLALAEAWAITRQEHYREPVARAVRFLERTQQPGGGWDYHERYRDGRGDLSITGWVVMALKSAAAGGLALDDAVLRRIGSMLRTVRVAGGGEFRYATKDSDRGGHYRRRGSGMAAVGALSLMYMGTAPDSPYLKSSLDRIANDPPSWKTLSEPARHEDRQHTLYYWYYGTLAMFQKGGESWQTWNDALKAQLLPNQRRYGHLRGSWDSPGEWIGSMCGRLYSTTLSVLTLEVYYRYLPLYQGAPLVLSGDASDQAPMPFDKAAAVIREGTSQAEIGRALDALAESGRAEAAALIAQQMARGDGFLRWKSILALGQLGRPEGVAPLLSALDTPGFERWEESIFDSLKRIGDQGAVPGLIAMLDKPSSTLERRFRAVDTLSALSGQHFGADAQAWRHWWKNRSP